MSTASSATPMNTECDVLIVGAGPVGALAGLLLAQRELKVILIEKGSSIIPSPRALVYHPQVNLVLEEVGLLADVREAGVVVKDGLAWRKSSDHSSLGSLDLNALHLEDKPQGQAREPVLLGQPQFTGMVLEKFKQQSGQVWFECAFKSFEQTENQVQVVVSNSKDEESVVTTKFLIGADGGHSNIRNAIGQHLDGFTHDIPLVAVNFRYSQIQATGFGMVQFLVDPTEDPADSNWSIIIYTGSDDVWRCAYGDGMQYSDDELKERVPMKLKKILPLHPNPDQYELLQAQPYKVHQRCVDSFVKGRVLLAGDAAHLNNPAGGLGMNTGLLDARAAVTAISDCVKLTNEQNVNQRLKEYSDVRKKAFLEFTNPVTIDNLRRLVEKSDEADEKLRKSFFASLKDPDFQRKMQLSQNMMGLGVEGL